MTEKPNVYMQWKGIDLCCDLRCSCGSSSHFDGFFAYSIECPSCGAVWDMPDEIELKPNADKTRMILSGH